MELKAVRYEVDEAVATITLDQPHRRTAWTGRTHGEYPWTAAGAEGDGAVGATVPTSAGPGFAVSDWADPDFPEGVSALAEMRSPAFR